MKEKKLSDRLLDRTYDRLASQERKYVARYQQTEQKPLTIMCIGVAGTGVNSRIGGHLRYGGKQFRRRHRRYVTVGMTNEYCTSQICSSCFFPVCRPQKTIILDNKRIRKSVNGGSICYNPRCPSYLAGCNTRNRDVQAAINIALAGVTAMSGRTLPSFTRTPVNPKTGNNFTAEPSVNGAPLGHRPVVLWET